MPGYVTTVMSRLSTNIDEYGTEHAHSSIVCYVSCVRNHIAATSIAKM